MGVIGAELPMHFGDSFFGRHSNAQGVDQIWARLMAKDKPQGRPNNAFNMIHAAVVEPNGRVWQPT